MEINEMLAQEFGLKQEHVNNILALIDEGNTLPFIARYRKEMTGNIDDQVLRKLSDRYETLTALAKRRAEVQKSIEDQGKWTDELAEALAKASTMTEIEDIYRPYKQKKKTRATIARSKGLEPLAEIIYAQDIKEGSIDEICAPYINEELGVLTTEDALAGAKDIIAENVSDDAELRKKLRNLFLMNGEITSKLISADKDEAKTYEMYYDYSESVSEIKPHRVLAMNRGEKDECLRIHVSINEAFGARVCAVGKVKEGSITTKYVQEAVEDSYSRLIAPSIEREVRNILTDGAEERAVSTFGLNLKPLLMAPPLKDKVTMGFDPAYRTGCKIAVVDATGKVLDTTVVYPTPPQDKKEEAAKELKRLIAKYGIQAISIGNGTASKESEMFVEEMLRPYEGKVQYYVVSEAGASVYSGSPLAAKEFPDLDLTKRSAISIARRLQDPLAELIKIDPQAIGVGQYQHDISGTRLSKVVDGVLEDCVNSVGVDLNTASPSLLAHVSGLNQGVAENIVAYREENGKFKSRKELKKVPKLGDKTFTQCAGFLRIRDGKSILDNTAVHPESYDAAEKLLSLFGYTDEDVKNHKLDTLMKQVMEKGRKMVAEECGIGELTLTDIVSELMKPGRDVRDSLEKVALRKDIKDISDLKIGMKIKGTVRNVTDFGAFVDIGVHQDGLVHISQIADRFVKNVSEVVKVGDIVDVTVLDVNVKTKRISLTMKKQPEKK